VRIIKESYLRDAAKAYPKAAKYLTVWIVTVRAAQWDNLADLRRSYPSADQVIVRSGRSVIVFNVCAQCIGCRWNHSDRVDEWHDIYIQNFSCEPCRYW
jgi:mRNA-degrading endonuclease HigB of HigAB toxin-antitoxin module